MRTIQTILFLLLVPVLAAAQSWVRISDVDWPGKITTLRTDPVTMFIGNMRSSDGGATWTPVVIDTSMQFDFVLTIHPILESVIYARASELNPLKHVILKSRDAGVSFESTNMPGNLKQIYISPVDPNLFFGFKFPYAEKQEIIGTQPMSFDGGLTWNDTVYHKLRDDTEPGLSKSATTHWYEESLLFDIHPVRPGTYTRVHYTHYWNSVGVEWAYELTKRTENGIFNDWVEVRSWPEDLHYARELIHTPTGDTLLHRTKSSIWMSPDLGDTWNMIYRDDTLTTSCMLFDALRNSILLGLDSQGILYLPDLTQSWQFANTGLRSINIRDLHTDHNGAIYALTDEGLYLFDPTPVVVGTTPVPQALSLTLAAPYPNPATQNVRLDYTLSRDAHTTLSVYDTFGRKVATLTDEYLQRGSYTNNAFDVSGLPMGVYFVILQSAGQRVAERVLVVRQ